MRICEYKTCKKKHDGKYGSGRFCSSKCARAYSTSSKRKEINKKVSLKLTGKWNGHGFKKGDDKNRKTLTDEDRKKAVNALKEKRKVSYAKMKWEELPKAEKRRRILKEQKGKCLGCGLNSWLGKKLTLELDHKNGDHSDNRRKNLRILCPNCHSQTPTYRNKRRNG